MSKSMESNFVYHVVRTTLLKTNTMKRTSPTLLPMQRLFMMLHAKVFHAKPAKREANALLMPPYRVRMAYKIMGMISSTMHRMVVLLHVDPIKRDGTSTYTLHIFMSWRTWRNRLWYSSLD